MAKHVFVFGAGASASAGAPMMAGFLDTAERLNADLACPINHDVFNLVFRGIAALKRAHSNAQLDVDNIEAVLGAFEAAALFGHLEGFTREEVERLPQAVRILIIETIEQTFKFRQHQGRINPPADYERFVALLAKIPRGQRVAIITFNYDLGLDYAISRGSTGFPIDYCLTEGAAKPNEYRLLKLHGSLNWRRVEDPGGAGRVLFEPISNLMRNIEPSGDGADVVIPFGRLIQAGQAPIAKGTPVIVPPTWSKSAEYKAISPVWRAATEELRDAEHIYVIGFSLPVTDTFFPMLFALGTIGSTRIKNFRVFDPNVSQVGPRFAEILGPVAKRRFSAHAVPFVHAVTTIGNAWAGDPP